MSYITPDMRIILLRNIPLDPTYEHTIYWGDSQNVGTLQNRQTGYFTGANAPKVLTLDNNSYQRVSKEKLRISVDISTTSAWAEIMAVNYMAFKNVSFNGKWFYAFVTNVEYINNRVCEIEYKLDVMQTWYFDYTLGKCFVEREHSQTDNLFDNLVPENLDIGNTYQIAHVSDFDLSPNRYMCLYTYPQPDSTTPGTTPSYYEWGEIKNNIYSPLKAAQNVLPNPNTQSAEDYLRDIRTLNTFINQDVGTQNIVALYQFPGAFLPNTAAGHIGEPVYHIHTLDSFDPRTNNPTVDNYQVRNKKLLSYPYNLMMLSNNAGQTAEYHFENFQLTSEEHYTFKIAGVCVTQPVGICYPYNYRGLADDYEDGVTISNFPVCAWAGNAFAEWWAQNKNSFLTSNIASILGNYANTAASIGVGAALGTVVAPEAAAIVGGASLAVNTAAQVANSVAKIQDLKAAPAQLRGQAQSDCLNAAMKRYKYTFYHLQIKREFAYIIDDYFDRYGYATKRNKIPNRGVRPYWCYTKTLDCNIMANDIPNNDIVKIAEIYNHGITFWKWQTDPATNLRVGDYTQDNRV